jgi:hypothetical protein
MIVLFAIGVSTQHDAFEFLLNLLDHLHHQLRQVTMEMTSTHTALHLPSLSPSTMSSSVPSITNNSILGNTSIDNDVVSINATTSSPSPLPDSPLVASTPIAPSTSVSSTQDSTRRVYHDTTDDKRSISSSNSSDSIDIPPSSSPPSSSLSPSLLSSSSVSSLSRSERKLRVARERGERFRQCAEESWSSYISRKGLSLITSHFVGQSRQSISCPQCPVRSLTFPSFQYIDVPLFFTQPPPPPSSSLPSSTLSSSPSSTSPAPTSSSSSIRDEVADNDSNGMSKVSYSLTECVAHAARGEIVKGWNCPKCKVTYSHII